MLCHYWLYLKLLPYIFHTFHRVLIKFFAASYITLVWLTVHYSFRGWWLWLLPQRAKTRHLVALVSTLTLICSFIDLASFQLSLEFIKPSGCHFHLSSSVISNPSLVRKRPWTPLYWERTLLVVFFEFQQVRGSPSRSHFSIYERIHHDSVESFCTWTGGLWPLDRVQFRGRIIQDSVFTRLGILLTPMVALLLLGALWALASWMFSFGAKSWAWGKTSQVSAWRFLSIISRGEVEECVLRSLQHSCLWPSSWAWVARRWPNPEQVLSSSLWWERQPQGVIMFLLDKLLPNRTRSNVKIPVTPAPSAVSPDSSQEERHKQNNPQLFVLSNSATVGSCYHENSLQQNLSASPTTSE